MFGKKKALIIGGSGGIGAAITRALAKTAASLVVHGGRASPKFDTLMREVDAEQVIYRFGEIDGTDTTDGSPLDRLCASPLYEHAKTADILCVCFGPFLQKPLHETTPREWAEISFCNYALPGIFVSAALPHMTEKGWGRILLFGGTGTQCVNGFRTNAAYAGAKTALCSMVKSIAAGYAQNGITCNALLPGFTATEYIDENTLSILREKIPGGRLIQPDELAESALFLLSHNEINGALINIDKGWKP